MTQQQPPHDPTTFIAGLIVTVVSIAYAVWPKLRPADKKKTDERWKVLVDVIEDQHEDYDAVVAERDTLKQKVDNLEATNTGLMNYNRTLAQENADLRKRLERQDLS